MKKTKPVERTKDGTLVLDFYASEASLDWLPYGLLKEKAHAGDEEAKKEIERMDASEMIEEGE
jgi:hypothetical protein